VRRLKLVLVAAREDDLSEDALFVFMLHLRSFDFGRALRCGLDFWRRDVRPLGDNILLEGLALPFVRPEYGTVKPQLLSMVFDREGVILLM
jgi:hypothetical protein